MHSWIVIATKEVTSLFCSYPRYNIRCQNIWYHFHTDIPSDSVKWL